MMTKQKTKQLLKLLQELKTAVDDHDAFQDSHITNIDEVITIIYELDGHNKNCVCPDCCSIS